MNSYKKLLLTNMQYIKLKTEGKSLEMLLKEYGTGSSGFFEQKWYKREKFFTEVPERGEYELYFDEELKGKTYDEQVGELKKDFLPSHPAIVIEAILKHCKETGYRLLKNWVVRTSSLDSDGSRVSVGRFDAGGLYVYFWYDDGRDGNIGLSAARKLPLNSGKLNPAESLTLESRVKSLEDDMDKIRNFLII